MFVISNNWCLRKKKKKIKLCSGRRIQKPSKDQTHGLREERDNIKNIAKPILQLGQHNCHKV